MLNKRLLANLKKNAHNLEMKEIELYQFNDENGNAIFVIHGPMDTPYEGFSFRVSFAIGPEFPFKPPSVQFIDPIWNPFVDFKTGLICCDILSQESWSPALATYGKVLISLISLLG